MHVNVHVNVHVHADVHVRASVPLCIYQRPQPAAAAPVLTVSDPPLAPEARVSDVTNDAAPEGFAMPVSGTLPDVMDTAPPLLNLRGRAVVVSL